MWDALQFDPVLKYPNGKEKLPRFMDPSLGDNYPLEAAWKVNVLLSFRLLLYKILEENVLLTKLFAVTSLMYLVVTEYFQMAQLAEACTQEDPTRRPNMRKAVVALMTLSSSTQDWELSSFGRHSGSSTSFSDQRH